MQKKYLILLVTIFLLASCNNDSEKIPVEVVDTLAPIENLNNVETPTVEESTSREGEDISNDEVNAKEEDNLLETLDGFLEKEEQDGEESEQKRGENRVAEKENQDTGAIPKPPKEEELPVGEISDDPATENPPKVEELDTPEPVIPVDEKIKTPVSKVIELNQTYTSPGGEESLSFTIRTSGDNISGVTVQAGSVSDIGKVRIASFSDSINSIVSGKTLEEAQSIGVVGGSSLTTGAFKAALKDM